MLESLGKKAFAFMINSQFAKPFVFAHHPDIDDIGVPFVVELVMVISTRTISMYESIEKDNVRFHPLVLVRIPRSIPVAAMSEVVYPHDVVLCRPLQNRDVDAAQPVI